MPQSTKHQHPDGRVVTFREDDHTYTDDRGLSYRSVSSIISQFAKPFDQAANAERVAKREGKTVEAVIAEWKESGRKACEYGTRVHTIAEWALKSPEIALKGKQMPLAPIDMAERVVFVKAAEKAAQIAIEAREAGKRVYIEQLLAAPTLGIAGTCDVLIATDQSIEIIDWKTNRNLTRSFGNMLEPVAHLDDSPLSKYAIQLNLYWRLICEAYCPGERPTFEGRIVHLKRSGEIVEHRVPALDSEIDAILQRINSENLL